MVRPASQMERSLVRGMVDDLSNGRTARQDLALASQIATGTFSDNKILMGLLEGALVSSTQPVSDTGSTPLYTSRRFLGFLGATPSNTPVLMALAREGGKWRTGGWGIVSWP